MKQILAITLLAAAAAVASPAQAAPQQTKNVNDIKYTLADESIIFPESYEADAQKMMESWYLRNYTATDDHYRTMPDVETSDEVIKRRLAEMPVRIEMPFNKVVREYIDRYTKRGRAQVSAILGLSIYYMPIFEQALEEEGIPLELKYLPVIESALNPNAVSRHGAAGLWQFMLGTAKGVGLEVNSLVDERRDPYASSRHAARYLHDLYDMYGDWSLAIAAYNCGSGAVNKAIRRAGGDPASHDFWSIYNYLTPETRGYVPMFIAANYVMTYYPKHNISPVLPTKPLVTDTVMVGKRVHFDQISKVLNIPVDELRVLNPQFRADVIPGSENRRYTLVLPSQQSLAYVMSEDNIVAFEADKYTRRTEVDLDNADDVAALDDNNTADRADAADGNNSGDNPSREEPLTASHPQEAPEAEQDSFANAKTPTRTITHTVAAGETISDIAALYKVTVVDIRSWNSLRRNAVRQGQKLRIQTTVPASHIAEQSAPKESKNSTSANAQASSATSSKKSAASATSGRKSTSSKSSQKSSQKKTAPKSHNIKSGENLTTIAKKYGVTVNDLRKANGLSGDNIRAGQTLKIPAKSSGSSSKKKSKKRRR